MNLSRDGVLNLCKVATELARITAPVRRNCWRVQLAVLAHQTVADICTLLLHAEYNCASGCILPPHRQPVMCVALFPAE